MFTVADIRNIAIQIEKNGEETYRKVGEQTSDPEVAALFLHLADQEARHAKWFESIRSDKPLTPEQKEMEAMGKGLLQDIVKSQTFSLDSEHLQKAENSIALLAQSIAFEKDTIQFYEFLQGFLDNEESVEQLALIINEEKVHVEQLEQLQGRDIGSALFGLQTT